MFISILVPIAITLSHWRADLNGISISLYGRCIVWFYFAIFKIFMDVSFSLFLWACVQLCVLVHLCGVQKMILGVLSLMVCLFLWGRFSSWIWGLCVCFFFFGQDPPAPPASWGHRCVWMPGLLDEYWDLNSSLQWLDGCCSQQKCFLPSSTIFLKKLNLLGK